MALLGYQHETKIIFIFLFFFHLSPSIPSSLPFSFSLTPIFPSLSLLVYISSFPFFLPFLLLSPCPSFSLCLPCPRPQGFLIVTRIENHCSSSLGSKSLATVTLGKLLHVSALACMSVSDHNCKEMSFPAHGLTL